MPNIRTVLLPRKTGFDVVITHTNEQPEVIHCETENEGKAIYAQLMKGMKQYNQVVPLSPEYKGADIIKGFECKDWAGKIIHLVYLKRA